MVLSYCEDVPIIALCAGDRATAEGGVISNAPTVRKMTAALRGRPSRGANLDRKRLSACAQRRFDLVDARVVIEVEQPVDLRLMDA